MSHREPFLKLVKNDYRLTQPINCDYLNCRKEIRIYLFDCFPALSLFLFSEITGNKLSVMCTVIKMLYFSVNKWKFGELISITLFSLLFTLQGSLHLYLILRIKVVQSLIDNDCASRIAIALLFISPYVGICELPNTYGGGEKNKAAQNLWFYSFLSYDR